MTESVPSIEVRCSFKTLGDGLQCRWSEGHVGPHMFIWVPGDEARSAALLEQLVRTREALMWACRTHEDNCICLACRVLDKSVSP
jgi:hypothetical protein